MLENFFKKSRPNIPEEYEIVYSHRKSLAIQVKSPWIVIIRAPSRCANIFIENFVNSRRDWIEKNLQKIQQKSQRKNYNSEEIAILKEKLRKYILPKVEELWQKTDFPKYGTIKITKSEGRWWSCSSKNNLNFSYRLAEYLETNTDFIDAVIIHELCHIKEKNHWIQFWKLVYEYCPEYKKILARK